MILKLISMFLTPVLVFQLAQAQHQNVRISKITSTSPEEVTIAVNPVRQGNLAAGANLNFSYYSTDSGYTWREQTLTSGDFGVWGDPCVVFDGSGNLYYGHLSNPPPPGYWIDRIVVQRSTDGGANWNNGTGIGFNPPGRMQDKEWLAADITGSHFHNNVYMAWTEFDNYGSLDPMDSTRVRFARSTDGGLTWSEPVRLSDEGGNCVDSDSTVEGAVPAVGPRGEVYVSWSGPSGIIFDKSTDGGVTFGRDIFVTEHPGGWDISIPGIYRCNGMPVTACDVSNSPFRGNIYINWADQRNGISNTDIYLIKSTDGGDTWGPAVRVNDDISERHQFFTWMAVDRLTGYIYIVFYDRRNTSGDTTDVFVARSVDGGENFTNFKVSAESYLPRADIFFGDYTNIAALDGRVYPIWMRMDGTALSVWTAIIDEREERQISVNAGWNLMSVPMYMRDYSNDVLFPGAVSDAFRFDGTYQSGTSVGTNFGFWMKFDSSRTIDMRGVGVMYDSIVIKPGWNIIGTIDRPVPVSDIASDPPAMVVSEFFAYTGSGYASVDTITPFGGYWVKSDQAGKLILREHPGGVSAGRIVVRHGEDLPPSPPAVSDNQVTREFFLQQNYPNPFNPETRISFFIGHSSHVLLKVFDMLGRELDLLINEIRQPGMQSVSWDGSRYPSGIYYYKLNAGGFTDVKKMLLIR